MTAALLQRFQRVISARTGLHIRPRDGDTFQAALLARIQELRLSDPQEYCRLLESGASLAEPEWAELASRLTNRESYFFRDKGQMSLLRDQILPELIENNRARKSLRVWSAGCSTGEEPYSLAMLLDELLPQPNEWQMVILGTDLNRKTLAEAERGVFSEWSFRTVEPYMQQRYFRRTRDGWEIIASVRDRVTFSPSNLTHDVFPNAREGIHDMDLILCRNVFIYFERDAIPPVARKLANTLREGGCLMTGHAEIDSPVPDVLQARRLPGSLVYQRIGVATAGKSVERPTSSPSPAVISPPRSSGSSAVPRRARTEGDLAKPLVPGRETWASVSAVGEPAFHVAARTSPAPGEYVASITQLETLLAEQPEDLAALYLLAQAYTNQGRREMAVNACRRASELNPLAAGPYEVLAALAEDHGEHEEAKRFLKKAIYLSPHSAAAYVELGAIYAREGERARAKKMWSAAHELLLRLPADATVTPWKGPPAGEWLRHVEVQLAAGD